MNFYDRVSQLDLRDVLRRAEYVEPSFRQEEKVLQYFQDCIEEDSGVYVYGDCDVDGLMCALIVRDSLQRLGCSRVLVHEYVARIHSLEYTVIQECIHKRCRYLVVCDAGSSDLEKLVSAVNHGIRVILLDHHETDTTEFPVGIAAINTMLEDSYEVRDLSAGALCWIVMNKLMERYGRDAMDLVALGAISLQSDSMNMRGRLNRSIWELAVGQEEYPRYVNWFMGKYQVFCSRWVNFWFAPRINNAFRVEAFELLNALFFRDLTAPQIGRCLLEMESSYESTRDTIKLLTDCIEVMTLRNFVLADLSKFGRYANYTGLVANKLSERYSKTAVVYCTHTDGYKGSLRDHCGRNYLTIFKNICRAGGHGPAFGFSFGRLELDRVLHAIGRVDRYYSVQGVSNEPIIVRYDLGTPDSIMIEDMARYNEYACGIPHALLKKEITPNMRKYKSPYYFQYSWGDYTIQSDYALNYGSEVLVRPTVGKRTKLIVQQR